MQLRLHSTLGGRLTGLQVQSGVIHLPIAQANQTFRHPHLGIAALATGSLLFGSLAASERGCSCFGARLDVEQGSSGSSYTC